MPKKIKVLTKTLYTYAKPINNAWVRREYKKAGFTSYSAFVDNLITQARLSSSVKVGGKKKSTNDRKAV